MFPLGSVHAFGWLSWCCRSDSLELSSPHLYNRWRAATASRCCRGTCTASAPSSTSPACWPGALQVLVRRTVLSCWRGVLRGLRVHTCVSVSVISHF